MPSSRTIHRSTLTAMRAPAASPVLASAAGSRAMAAKATTRNTMAPTVRPSDIVRRRTKPRVSSSS
jgi:hypothetical protein